MTTRQRKKSFLNRLILPVIAISFLGYFGFHAFEGAYGLVSYQRIQGEIKTLEGTLAELQEQRRHLTMREALLSHGSPDREMVDELAREKLNVVHPNELIYLVDFN